MEQLAQDGTAGRGTRPIGPRRALSRLGIVLGGSMLCLAAAPAPVPAVKDTEPAKQPPPARPAMIEVVGASYGGRNDTTPCDASASVISACNRRFSCAIPVDDRLCAATGGLTPLIPTLRVTYRCSDAATTRSRSEEKPFMLRITCTPPRH